MIQTLRMVREHLHPTGLDDPLGLAAVLRMQVERAQIMWAGTCRLRLSEIVLRTLLDAGFGHKDAAYAGLLLNDYVTMFVLEEAQDANAQAESASGASFSGIQHWVEALPPNDYPSVVALADYFIEPDVDERFRFGIEILRNGLETCLAKR